VYAPSTASTGTSASETLDYFTSAASQVVAAFELVDTIGDLALAHETTFSATAEGFAKGKLYTKLSAYVTPLDETIASLLLLAQGCRSTATYPCTAGRCSLVPLAILLDDVNNYLALISMYLDNLSKYHNYNINCKNHNNYYHLDHHDKR
jgi:hypothetical protein